jgi:hypothetical protein
MGGEVCLLILHPSANIETRWGEPLSATYRGLNRVSIYSFLFHDPANSILKEVL